MRIVGGKYRSIKLQVPCKNTRPTSDRLKESLFNAMFQVTTHQVWMDLYAGSGAIGIEALSRGAQHVLFSDVSQEAIKCISNNVAKIHARNKATIINEDAHSALNYAKKHKIIADVVFLDPPYAQDISNLINDLLDSSTISECGLLIIEQAADDKEYDIDKQVLKIKERKVGKSMYRIYQVRKSE